MWLGSEGSWTYTWKASGSELQRPQLRKRLGSTGLQRIAAFLSRVYARFLNFCCLSLLKRLLLWRESGLSRRLTALQFLLNPWEVWVSGLRAALQEKSRPGEKSPKAAFCTKPNFPFLTNLFHVEGENGPPALSERCLGFCCEPYDRLQLDPSTNHRPIFIFLLLVSFVYSWSGPMFKFLVLSVSSGEPERRFFRTNVLVPQINSGRELCAIATRPAGTCRWLCLPWGLEHPGALGAQKS